jgi:NADPH:quinone reductase-like Zn-dependent oxidoreductase
MKAAIFDEPGLANLRVMDNVKKPVMNDHDVLIRVTVAGVNPIDNFVVSGALPNLIPLPNHIPGAEISGVVEEVGSHVNRIILRKMIESSCTIKSLMTPVICVLMVLI